MAEQMRPASPERAPDPATSYERAKPEKEAGAGRMDNNVATPTHRPDQMDQAVDNKQPPRQVNAEDVGHKRAEELPAQPDHSMKEEQPLGEDEMPTDIHDPRFKRHPRDEGRGGTP